MKRRAWLVNGVLMVGSLALSLAVAEVAVRLVAPQPTGLSSQDRYGLALHYPGITRYLPQFGHEVSFNAAGMRDREHTETKPAGTYRVLLLGDSFMEALQVTFDSSTPALIERELAARTGRKVEVINAGVSGWGTDDELRYLTQYGLKYQPDLVVVMMTLHNDISDNLRQQWYKLDQDQLVEREARPMPLREYAITRVKAWLATRLQLYQLWRRVRHRQEIRGIGANLRSHVTQLFEEPPPPAIDRGMKLTGKLLGRMRDVTAAHGGKMAVVLLPIIYQLSDTGFAQFVTDAKVPLDSVRILRPQQTLTAMADSLGLPVVDLLPPFRQWVADSTALLYLGWDGHWNAAGHRLAAALVTEGLLRARVVD